MMPRPRNLPWLLTAAAAVVAVVMAYHRRWMTDDAFISFRYAQQLVHGNGLVFNAGERVEGFSNPLWTIWIAFGMRLHVSPETWTAAWGLVSLAAIIAGLGLFHVRMARRLGVATLTLPLGALIVACHTDMLWFATGGLETASFTALMLATFLMLTATPRGRRFDMATGAVAALCGLSRPEGVLAAGLGGAYLLVYRRRSLLAFVIGFAAVWVPPTIWRVRYYGDFFPNTVHAKAGAYGKFHQGLFYVWLYFKQYWALLLSAPLVLFHWRRFIALSEIVLAAAFACAYGAFVIAVAGDFMFARFLIPATPFILILLDAGVLAHSTRHRWVQPVLAAGLCAAIATSVPPFKEAFGPRGIALEYRYYTPERVQAEDARAAELRRYTEGLDYSVAFLGSECRFVYRAETPLAIECEAGLTDRVIARAPVPNDGEFHRVGHEKFVPLSYLIDEREIDMTFHQHAWRKLNLEHEIPRVDVQMGTLHGFLLHWNPDLVAGLRERGAEVRDFPAALDDYIASMPQRPKYEIERDYVQFKRFYFDHVYDPTRQWPFDERLTQP